MKAELNNYRQSPRKVRIVADLVKGKSVGEALQTLSFLPKRAALPVEKLIASAVANAKQNNGENADSLIIKSISVDGGVVMKRTMPRARGSAYMIKKRTSHINIVLGKKNK